MNPNKQSLTADAVNPQGLSADNQSLADEASNQMNTAGPGMPQPLNTAAQTPVGMTPETPNTLGRSAGEGLPAQSSGNPVVSASSGGSKKIMIMIIVILILAIIGAGVYYFYSSDKPEKEAEEVVDNQSMSELTGLEGDLENIETSDPENDLTELNQDINLLEATPSSR